MDNTLISEVKNYLDKTWDDESTDNKISGIMTRAKSILESYAGCSIDFELPKNEMDKQLFFDCCRYIDCNAYEDFKNNFSAELIMIRARHAVFGGVGNGEEISDI